MTTTISIIQENLAQRLATIKQANGYETDVKNVYYDTIPMGLELEPHQLPAILLIATHNEIERKVGCNINKVVFEVQLIGLDTAPDSYMFDFISNIYKAIFANSPTADILNLFRTIHPSIFDIKSDGSQFDLNMIEANRFAIIDLQVFYNATYINI